MEITQTLLAKQKLQALEVAARSVIQPQEAPSLTVDASDVVSKGDNGVSQEQHEPKFSQSDKR
jgi:hypothetical protein